MWCGQFYMGWVIPYANKWEDHSNNWGTIHSLVFWQCLGTALVPLGVSFFLQIEDQGLVEFELSSWTHLILIGLGLPWWLRWYSVCLQCRRPGVQSLGGEDPLEKETTIYSSTLAWKILSTEERGRLQPTGSQRVGHDWVTSLFTFTFMLWAFFQKLCLAPFLPVSCSFPEPRLGPQCCLYNLLEGQPENSWPLGGKYRIISNPSRYSGPHLLCFLQHMQEQHFSVKLLGQVTDTQCLLEVHLWWHPFKGNWASRDNACHFGS